MQMDKKIVIRLARPEDLSVIVKIYNQAIRSRCATGDMDEFGVEDRQEWFKKFDPDNFPIYVAEIENTVVGYCTISPYRSGRRAMSKVAEVSYYLDYTFHGKGIGSCLLKYIISDCKRIGKQSLLAILLDINYQSIGLLEKFNFVQWGHFPGIVNMDGVECGQFVYGLKLNQA